jgi:hypothetical protein
MAVKNTNIIGSAKSWIYKLMGKTPPVIENETSGENAPQETQGVQEDSVANDMRMLKEFAKKSVEKAKTVVAPYAKKGMVSVSDTSKVVSTSADHKFIKTLIRTFLILFFTVVLIFIAIYLYRMLQKENVAVQPGSSVSVTPVPFSPFKPSVYALDPEVLQLEEEINILERELARVNIKEEGVNPPKLDFSINFKN